MNQMWVRIARRGRRGLGGRPAASLSTFVDLMGVPSAEELHQMIQGLRATHPDVDAIVCLPEGLGVGILSTLRELGHSVPDDIQLVSYTDSPTLADRATADLGPGSASRRMPACGPANC